MKEGRKEGGREGGREGRREGGKEGGREREGEREGEREEGREEKQKLIEFLSVQVPQFILDNYTEHNMATNCNIIVTQPRRISAISIAERVAVERGETVGTNVGYQVCVGRV